ncbi:MAG TPA: hypothetical protein DCE48_04920 [Lachnospiraceae bacterium]|nr:hypothetical protein [Lachnospiraceae bacterium]
MKQFEKGKQYDLRYKSKKWNELAGKIEIVDLEYFDRPVEIRGNDIKSIAQIGKATIKYMDTKYYKNKLYNVEIVGYFKTEFREKESTCISLNNKFYFSVFID